MTQERNQAKRHRWARPGMKVTFKAELMPGKTSEERTFIVKEVLWNDRVTLYNLEGEHQENEFEPITKQ
ncbi:MAG: hypothetical protein D6687_10955 [Acidobacteria bacterium]|jgi:hypothetical protein|nr:MAG: hypothetical protein D6687_10955 [Acidobacteriota bacterium]GIU81374.1 MAG: hypothetical protein KatS3mg006_0438 [Pyrinomonadaceae bacterium]